MAASIRTYFAELPDPRADRGKRHLLSDLLVIAVCGVLCGADDWVDIEEFGKARLEQLRQVLALPHGIPTHGTFGLVFARLDPEAFERCFCAWTAALAAATGGKILRVDGKSLRRSFEHAWNASTALHMVGVFASDNQMVLSQLKADEHDEIGTIQKVLALLDLQGALVSIDAAGCQHAIARQIVDGGGDYLLALKANQPTLLAKVQTLLQEAVAQGGQGLLQDRLLLDKSESVEGDHGRIETRRVYWTPEIEHLRDVERLPGLKSVGMVESVREVAGKAPSLERRYFVSSLEDLDATAFGALVRGHWGIENQVHHVLDVSFREDASRIRKGHGAENFARLRRIALNLLRRDKTKAKSIKTKRFRAALDYQYLLDLLLT